jgi:hypothetical protein
MRIAFGSALVGLLSITAMAMAAVGGSKTNQVTFSYEPPENPAHQALYKELRDLRVLERLQEFLSPVRLPRTLKFSMAGCDGEDDAFYWNDAITICYELVERLYANMPAKRTLAGIEPIDTVIGPFFDTALHEFAHALFDLLNIPVLGREEDAADQVGAYIYLQLADSEARRLVMGAAYGFFVDARSDDAPRTREEFSGDFAEEHGMPEQRAYNLLCMAYGADKELFGDLVSKGHLPRERAESCIDDYEQVLDAVEILIRPHVDRALAEKTLGRNWIRKTTRQEPRGRDRAKSRD